MAEIANPPAFVTFTGLDEKTDLERVKSLSANYHVEWGVLFSKSKQGKAPRYPGEEWISGNLKELADSGVRLAAHVCGAYSRKIMEEGLLEELDFSCFRRVQVNHANPTDEGYGAFRSWLDSRLGPTSPAVIVQARGPFAADYRHRLYDPSGGRGERPEHWPPHPGKDMLVGYAGGLNPENVVEIVSTLSELCHVEETYVNGGVVNRLRQSYWIDMESGIRTNDWLDLDKCEKILSLVGNRKNIQTGG